MRLVTGLSMVHHCTQRQHRVERGGSSLVGNKSCNHRADSNVQALEGFLANFDELQLHGEEGGSLDERCNEQQTSCSDVGSCTGTIDEGEPRGRVETSKIGEAKISSHLKFRGQHDDDERADKIGSEFGNQSSSSNGPVFHLSVLVLHRKRVRVRKEVAGKGDGGVCIAG